MAIRKPAGAGASIRVAKAFGSGFSKLFWHAHRAGLLPSNREVRVIADIPYGESRQQAVDLYLPAHHTGGPLPTFVFVHGGGWIACDRKMSAALGRTLAARGMAVVAPGYRLLPDVSAEAQRADVAASVDWLMTGGAERFGLDLTRFAIGGESAGAHLMMRSVQAWDARWPKPKGIVGVYGLYDIEHLADDRSTLFQPLRTALCQGQEFAQVSQDHTALRPLLWTDVPVLLLHGEADVLAPADQSRLLQTSLEKQGVPVRLRTYEGAAHGFIYDGHPKRRHVARSAYRSLYRFLLEAGLREESAPSYRSRVPSRRPRLAM